MSDTREAAPFSLIDSIPSTNIIADTEIETFLGSDPNKVTNLEDEPEEKPKPQPKKKPEIKLPDPEAGEESPNPLGADDLGDEEGAEDEEEKLAKKKDQPKVEEVPEENPFTSLTKDLKNLGVFGTYENEEEIKDGNQFRDRFNMEIQTRLESSINNFIGKFGDDYQEAFQAIYIDGVDPREYFQYSNSITNLEEYDLTVVDNQKQILKEYYKSIGWASDKISNIIQKREDSGDLEDEANAYHQVLLQKEKAQLDEIKRQKSQEQFQKQQLEQEYQAAVTKILNEKLQKKDFDGIPMDQKLAQNIAEYITVNKYRAANGDLLTDFDLEILNLKKPTNYEKKVKIAALLRLMETDPTLSKITKKAISQEKDEAFANLTRQKKNKTVQGEETYSSWNITK